MKLEVFADETGAYRWRLVGGNGEIMAPSEPYASKWSARRAAANLSAKIEGRPPVIYVDDE